MSWNLFRIVNSKETKTASKCHSIKLKNIFYNLRNLTKGGLPKTNKGKFMIMYKLWKSVF